MGYKWVLRFCPGAKFVMKADDDAFVDVYRVVKVLREALVHGTSSVAPVPLMTLNSELSSSQAANQAAAVHHQSTNIPRNVMSCSIFPNGTIPKRDGKWSLTFDQYPYSTFPPYCSGVAYFASIDVVFDILAGSQQVEPVIQIDDVFVTGIITSSMRIYQQPFNLRYIDSSPLADSTFAATNT